MACDIQAILTDGQELQAQLANYSTQEQLAALYILTCNAATVADCNPAVILAQPGAACIYCLTEQQLLTAITQMLCASGIGGASAPLISEAQLPGGIVGQAYSVQPLDYTGTATSWALVQGTLPTGLTLNTSTGLISGTPTVQAQPVSFAIKASNANGSRYRTLSIEINQNCAQPKPLGNTVLGSKKGQIFRYQYGGTGSAPFTWSVSAGTLPAGITLNATSGLLSGTPSATGSSFTIKATNACGNGTLDVQFGVDQ